jgi:dCTP deaminase
MGLFSHVTAGFGDVGFAQQWTLELVATLPICLYPGMRIGQISFHGVSDTTMSYKHGHSYASQRGPTEAKANNL